MRLGHIRSYGFLAAILHQLDLITRYIYANGQKISSWTRYRYRQTGRLDGSTKEDVPLGEFFYHDNHLGSSVLITDKNGKEKTRILYKPFGEIDQSHSVGLNATTMKFTSQGLDEESELYYYRSRFYDPSLGRFLNPDSIVPNPYNLQDYNRYAYVRNNPVIYTDPTGHCPTGVGCLVAAAIGFIAKVAWDIMTSPSDANAPTNQNDIQQSTPQAPDFLNLKKSQKGRGFSSDGSGIIAGDTSKNRTTLVVKEPKILSKKDLSPEELEFLQKEFRIKKNAINRAANRGELRWSPGTDLVRVPELQKAYREAVKERFKRRFGKELDLSGLNADHPVDLIINGSPTQRLKMLDESINKSVGSSLLRAGQKAGLSPGDSIDGIIFEQR